MPVYLYKAGREDGSVLTKEVQAESEEVLRRELEEDGLLVLSVRKRQSIGLSLGLGGFRRKQSVEEFLVFNQELIALVKAGLPIVQSLDILIERAPNENFKEALSDVKSSIRGGKALSESLAMHPQFFSELYCNSLRAGERTGNLAEVLGRFIVYQKRMLATKRQLKAALTYPVFLLGVTTLLLAFLITYVVPTFSEIYADFKGGLPGPTLVLMGVTRFIKNYIGYFFLGLLVLAIAFRAWYRTEGGRRIVDGYQLRLPLVGQIIKGYFISTVSRTLSTILAGGIPMLQALDMSAKSVTNRVLSEHLRYVQERVRQGASFADALDETKIMPAMTVRMIEVGEATGALEDMLDDISSFYEEEVNTRLQRLTSLIEPVIMLVMGFMVGGIVVVMYLPIFELAGAVS